MKAEHSLITGTSHIMVTVDVEGKPVLCAVSLKVKGLKAANAKVLKDILLKILVKGINET